VCVRVLCACTTAAATYPRSCMRSGASLAVADRFFLRCTFGGCPQPGLHDMRLAQAGAHSTVFLFALSILGALLAEALRLDSMHSRARALQRSWQLCAAAKRPSSQFRGVRPRAGGRWDAAITAGYVHILFCCFCVSIFLVHCLDAYWIDTRVPT
jgi:hypothetical protein